MAKITLLDGASGTLLWDMAENAGVAKDPVWKFNIEHPEFVEKLADLYIEAGSDIIFSNTFSANRPNIERNCSYSVDEVVYEGMKIAKDRAKKAGIKAFLDVGPLSQMLEPYGDMEEDECEELFRAQIEPGMKADPDGIMLETFMDLEMLKIAARVACSYNVPVFCSMTFEKSEKTMFGNSVDAIIEGLSEFPVAAVGMNCSVGPDMAIPILEEFHRKTSLPIIAKPNAGLPEIDAEGKVIHEYTAEKFVQDIAPALEYVSYVGSCCGSNPDYIRRLKTYISNITK